MSNQRGSVWSITINNPVEGDEECIAIARQKGWTVEGQLEKGGEGTPHYQLMVKTGQVRFSAVKKAFPRGHIEVARDVHALQAYVHKEATREGELPTQQEMYPSLSRFWDLITEHFNVGNSGGLDCSELPEVKFYADYNERLLKETPLVLLDEACRALIKRGYMVESIACNPSTRSSWKLFARELMYRSIMRREQEQLIGPQTDSQTDSGKLEQNVVVPVDITNGTRLPPPPPCAFWQDGPFAAHSCSNCSSVQSARGSQLQ